MDCLCWTSRPGGAHPNPSQTRFISSNWKARGGQGQVYRKDTPFLLLTSIYEDLRPAMPCLNRAAFIHSYGAQSALFLRWRLKKLLPSFYRVFFNPAECLAILLVRKAWWGNRFSRHQPDSESDSTGFFFLLNLYKIDPSNKNKINII